MSNKLNIVNMKGEPVGEVALPGDLATLKAGLPAVHQAVLAFQAGVRAGTASTKGKGAVAGSGKKPHRQKGTGQARAGYARSPVWVGGGVAHGPHPHSFAQALPKKVSRLAFRRAFAGKAADGELVVLETLELNDGRTREAAALQKALAAESGLLVIVDRLDPKIERAVRNLPRLEVAVATNVHTYQLLRWPRVAVTRAALAVLEQRMAAQVGRGA